MNAGRSKLNCESNHNWYCPVPLIISFELSSLKLLDLGISSFMHILRSHTAPV